MYLDIDSGTIQAISGHLNSSRDRNQNSEEDEDSEETPFISLIKSITEDDFNRKSLLKFCEQNSIQSFEEVFNQSLYRDIYRFDYGTYAELFTAIDNNINEKVVLKVIRVVSSDLKSRINGVKFHSIALFKEVHSECQISAALSNLRTGPKFRTNCYPRVYSKYLLDGDIPHYFLKEKAFDGFKPIRNDVFEDYASIPREYANKTITASQVLSVIKQVIIGLAVAEGAVELEHRDLHESNILIQETSEMDIQFIHNSKCYSIESHGLEATIIDTTFSRIKLNDSVFYKDLSSIMTFDEKLTLQDKAYKSMKPMEEIYSKDKYELD
ncbi:unnamed protein product [Medioppia subpectinata]|uniref:Protein kinase domain-containing protein n=1 Tax=Medioppia subpectinata TaxID=1979941 RepID=A0A7R9KJ22_9ACAR|nr:unnamed protein product [Medioppia subpectinata]CAG2104587.1 unnamed protein product [Medioppia subpectinata]